MAPKTVRSLDIHIVNILKLTCTYYASFFEGVVLV